MNNTMTATAAAVSVGFAATVERKALDNALKLAAKIVEARNTIPILSHVRLTVAGDVLTVLATDLDMWLTQPVSAEHGGAGAVCVDLKALRASIKAMSGDRVRLQDIGGRITVTDIKTGAVMRAATLPVADFPTYAETMGDLDRASFALPAEQLVEDLERVRPAISTEETRYYLNGIYCAAGDTFRMVATDGHRLAVAERPLPDISGEMPDVIIPRKAIAVALTIMGKRATGAAELEIARSRVAIRFGDVQLVSKTIDGTFPDYRRVIPSAADCSLSIDSTELGALASNASAHCTEKTPAVALSLTPEFVIASATDVSTGTAAIQANGAEYAGPPLRIGFNAGYVEKVAKAFGPQRLTMTVQDASAPALIKGEDPTFFMVLMPMRVGESAPMTPEDVRRLSLTPDQIFAENAPAVAARIAAAETSGERTAARRELGGMARTYRDFLTAGGMAPRIVHLIIAAAVARAIGDRRAEMLADAERGWIETGERPLIAVAPGMPAPVYVAPVAAPAAVDAIDPAQDAPEAAPADESDEGRARDFDPLETLPSDDLAGEDAPAETAPAAVDPDLVATLIARIDALETRIAAMTGPAEPAAAETEPQTEPQPDDRAELLAEIERLRDQVSLRQQIIRDLRGDVAMLLRKRARAIGWIVRLRDRLATASRPQRASRKVIRITGQQLREAAGA